MEYPVESFTAAEQQRLTAHFTNLDRPVFALVNLPETVKGALFARYSRYPGTLRRLFLDEFADDVPSGGPAWDGDEGDRAAQLCSQPSTGRSTSRRRRSPGSAVQRPTRRGTPRPRPAKVASTRSGSGAANSSS